MRVAVRGYTGSLHSEKHVTRKHCNGGIFRWDAKAAKRRVERSARILPRVSAVDKDDEALAQARGTETNLNWEMPIVAT